MKGLLFGYGVAVLLVCLVLAGCTKPAGAPTADFSANPTAGIAPLTVEFTDESNSGEKGITAWHWLFGDGAQSTEQDPQHVYAAEGTYNVSLEVTTASGSDTELKVNYITVSGTPEEGEPEEGEPEPGTETVLLPGGVPLVMKWIPGGTFMMGRYTDELDGYAQEDPQHSVTLGGFWMAKYELTKRQWTAVMNTTPWSGRIYVLADLDSPAVWVTWNDAQAFLTALNGYTGMTFRLPSEAQWEYACRAGSTTRFYWGNDPNYTAITDYAWYKDNAYSVGQEYAHVVGTKLPNAFGLYDMSGNVYEWCEDDWHGHYTGAPTGGQAWVDAPRDTHRIYRGGSFSYSGAYCRSAYRAFYNVTDQANYGYGFRVAR